MITKTSVRIHNSMRLPNTEDEYGGKCWIAFLKIDWSLLCHRQNKNFMFNVLTEINV